MGGLSKKAYQILNLEREENQQRLLLDAGNLLFKRPKVQEGPSQESLAAETIIDIYKELGYDAVGIGPLDLAGPIDLLKNSRDAGFPWISANLADEQGKPLFKQWVNRKAGETEIYITALTAPPGKKLPGIKILETEAVIPKLLKKFKNVKQNPFIILLSTLSNAENRKITEQYPDINLIIGADRSSVNISPKHINNSLFTQTEKQGKYQGLLQIIFGTTRQWGQDSSKQLADLQNKLGSLNWQLRRLEKKAKLAGQNEKFKATISRLINEKGAMNTKIDSLKEIVQQKKKSGAVNDQFIYRFIKLKKNMPNDMSTVEKLHILNSKIRKLHKNNKKTKQASKLIKGMAGYAVCETCHEAQFKFWENSMHASAFMTLVDKNKQYNLDCLPCHLTVDASNVAFKIVTSRGYLSYPAKMQSVGCESCHGPGKSHSLDPDTVAMLRLPDKQTCLTCHTSEHDDNFDYDVKIQNISCPAS